MVRILLHRRYKSCFNSVATLDAEEDDVSRDSEFREPERDSTEEERGDERLVSSWSAVALKAFTLG